VASESFPYSKPKMFFLRNLYNTQVCVCVYVVVVAVVAAAVVVSSAGTVIIFIFLEELITEILTQYRLDLSDITCKFRTVATFVIIKIQATFHA
jgi:hypothetical protein